MPGTATAPVMSAGDESALVGAAGADPRAFAALYQHHVSAIYRFCYRRLGTKEAAEDATAQVFTKALGGLAGYRGGSATCPARPRTPPRPSRSSPPSNHERPAD